MLKSNKPKPLTAEEALRSAGTPAAAVAKPKDKRKNDKAPGAATFEANLEAMVNDVEADKKVKPETVVSLSSKKRKVAKIPRKGYGTAMQGNKAWTVTAFVTTALLAGCAITAIMAFPSPKDVPTLLQVIWALTLAPSFVLWVISTGTLTDHALHHA